MNPILGSFANVVADNKIIEQLKQFENDGYGDFVELVNKPGEEE